MIKNLRRSVAEGGKIKIGGKGAPRPSKGGGTWAPPRKDDHFSITTNMREGGDPHANLIVNEEIMAALVQQGWADPDGKIRRLPISLLSDDIEQVFPTAYVCYAGKSLACRGDGVTAERFVDPRTGQKLAKPIEVQCPCERLEKDADGARRCKFNGILHCALRIPGHAVIGSVYRWRTTSEISVSQIVTHLEDVILPAAGTLRGLPLMLVLGPRQVSPGGKPKTVYVCHIDLCEDLVSAQRAALDAANLRRQLAGSLAGKFEQAPQVLQLPGHEDEDEIPDVLDEYYPDEVVGNTPAGAEVVSHAPVPITNPLAGILPKSEPEAVDAEIVEQPKAPPAKPATPPEETEGEANRRTRRTRCDQCGELWGPGIVVKGLCHVCRNPEPSDEPEDDAPEIGPGPPAPTGPTPYERLQVLTRETIARGVDQAAVLSALAKAWPDYGTRKWTDADIDLVEGIFGGLE